MLNSMRRRFINTIIYFITVEIINRHRCLILVARRSLPTNCHHPLWTAPHKNIGHFGM